MFSLSIETYSHNRYVEIKEIWEKYFLFEYSTFSISAREYIYDIIIYFSCTNEEILNILNKNLKCLSYFSNIIIVILKIEKI